jgi:hypothetical protein
MEPVLARACRFLLIKRTNMAAVVATILLAWMSQVQTDGTENASPYFLSVYE